MSKSLARFLADVAIDSDRLGGFLADPEGSIAEAGLGRRDREALLSGDQGAMLARLQPTAEPVPAEPVDDRKENGGMWSWSSPMVDPAAAAGSSWHYAAQNAAGPPMWHYAPPASMWMAPGASWHQAPAAFAAPPPMWTVSVVHVVHHMAGPPPAEPSEPSGD